MMYIFLGFLVSALGLIALGWFPQELLRRVLQTRLQEGLGPGSGVRRLHVVPGRLRTDVIGLVIEGPTYRLEVPRARVVFSPGLFWGRTLSFRSIEMENPRLTIRPDPGPYRETPPLRKPLIIRSLLVTHGTVTYAHPSQGNLVMRNLGMKGSIGEGAVDLASTGGAWERPKETLPAGPAAARLRVSSRLDIKVEDLHGGFLNSTFVAKGSLGRVGALRPDLSVQAALDLADLSRFDLPGMTGRLSATGRVARQGLEVSVEADVEGSQIDIAGWPIDRATGHVSREPAERAATRISLNIGLLGGRGELKGTLRGNAADARLQIADIDIERLRRQGVAAGLPIRGRLSGDMTAKGDPAAALDVRGSFRAVGSARDTALRLRATAEGRVRPRQRTLDLTWTSLVVATRTGRETMTLRGSVRSRGANASFDVDADGAMGSLRASGESRGPVLRRLALAGSSLQLDGLVAGTHGQATFRFDGSGPLDRLSGSGSGRIEDLAWREARIGTMTLNLVQRGGRGDLSFEAPDINATGTGRLDRGTLRLSAVLSGTPLAALRPLFSPDRPLEGQATGTVTATVPLSRPASATVVARLDSVDVTSGSFVARSIRPFTLTSRNRRITVEDLAVEGPGIAFQGSGGFGTVPGATLDLRGNVDADLSQLAVPPGWTLRGRARGRVELTGGVSRPRATGLLTLTDAMLERPGAAVLSVKEGQVELAGDVATTRGIRISLPGGTIDLSGQVPLAAVVTDPGLRARLGIDPAAPLDVEAKLDVDLAGVPARPGWRLAGRAEGELGLSGSLSHPHGVGFVTLRGASVTAPGAPLVSSAEGRVDLDGDVASTSGVTATVAGGTVSLTGSMPLATLVGDAATARLHLAPGDTQLHLVWNGVQAGALQEAFRPGKPSTISATLSGEARLDGNFTSIQRVRGDVQIPRTTVRIQELELQVEPLTVVLDQGRITASGLTVTSEAGTFVANGQVDLAGRTMDGTGHGQLELRALSPFLEEASLTGHAHVDLAVAGSLDAPQMNGTVQVSDGTLRVREFPQALTALEASLTFDGHTVRVSDTSGVLGGGTLSAWGTATVSGFRVSDVSLTLAGKDVGLRYPVGGIRRRSGRLADIKTRLDADLSLTGKPGDYVLAGDVKVQRGLYDADIFPGEALLAPETPPAPETHSPFLQSVALNVTMTTEHPFYVRNNLAQLEATGVWRVRGDLDEPAPFGRLDIQPGGKVFLQERELTVTSGSLVYNGVKDPDINVSAETLIPQVGEQDIEVAVTAQGTLDFPRLTLSSSPPRSEKELASLITTGRPDVGLNSGAWIVGEQAATLLTGRFTREVSRGLRELGFDQVDIRPELLAREDEPGARFTIGKDLSPHVKLVYSAGLNTPEAQYYQALFRFRAGSEITVKVQRRADGTVTYGAGQRLRFGGGPRRSDLKDFEEVRLREVRLQGDAAGRPVAMGIGLNEGLLRGWIHTRRGKNTTYWDLLNDGDRVREKLVQAGYLEAVVEPRLEGDVAIFVVQPGPHHHWRVEGMANPPDLGPEIQGALFGEEALERGRERLLRELRARGHLRAAVEGRDVNEGGHHALLFTATPGPRLAVAELRFPGATALSTTEMVDAAGGPAAILVSPKEAERAIRDLYHSELYLLAEVGPTAVAESNGQVRIVVPVQEGPRAVVAAVRFEGTTLPDEDLLALTHIEPGEAYDRIAVNDAVQRVRDHYLERGYASVRVLPRLATQGANLEVVLRVAEGEPVVAGPVSITGLRRTRASLVRRQVNIDPGDPLDPRKMAELERRLLDLGVFSRAVVTAPAESPAPITIELEEEAPYKLAYDLRYNDREGGTALVDAEMGNLFGTGVAVGGRYRLGRRVRDQRGSLHIPSLGRWGDLTASVFRLWQDVIALQEESPGAVPRPNERTTEEGFQIQQARHRHPYDLLYGFRRKRVTETFDLLTGGPRTLDIGALDVSLVRDTRENPLNARRGTFLSLNVGYGPEALGSEVTFAKTFAQAFLTKPLKASLTWAQGYRIGVATGLADDIFVSTDRVRAVSTERFRAGGANSIRGFATDSLGPRRTLSDGRVIAAGGQAVLVLNQELRLHHGTGLGAAIFYDAGNVYEKASDLGLDLRHSAGFGLRYDSVIGLLRVDLAFPLGRRAGEKSYRLFFGLGQAF